MNTKNKTIIFMIFTAVLAFGSCIACWAWGLFSQAGVVDWAAATVASGSVVGGLLIINVVCVFTIGRRLKNKVVNYSNGAVRNIKLKTVCAIVFSYVYLFALLALICFFCFASGRSGYMQDGSTLFILIPSYLAWGIMDTLFINTPLQEPPEFGAEFPHELFPLIYATADRAAKAAGYKKPFRLFLTERETITTEYLGCAYIGIGYLPVAVYTSDELCIVLAREFSRIVRSEVRTADMFMRIAWRWDPNSSNLISSFSKLALQSFPAAVMNYYIELYGLFTNADRERAADSAVKNAFDPRTFSDMIAKTEMLNKYAVMPVPELDYYLYRSETVPTDAATRDRTAYTEYYNRFGELWKDDIAHELKTDGVHAIARTRMENIGCTEFDANAVERDGMYTVEQQRVIAAADKLLANSMSLMYPQMHEEYYVERSADIRALDEAQARGEKLEGAKRNKALVALVGLDDDRALELADEMIADNDLAEYAQYSKGLILSRRRDDGFIACLKAAAKNPELTEGSYDRLINYARIMGKAELFDECGKALERAIREAAEKQNEKVFKKSTVTVPCDLSDEFVAQLAETLEIVSHKMIKAFYISKYVGADGLTYYPLAFDVKKLKVFLLNGSLDILNSVVNVLVGYKGDPIIFCCNTTPGMVRKVRKAEGAIVYRYNNK